MRQFFSISILITCLTAIASSAIKPVDAKSQHAVLSATAASINLAITASDLELSVNDSDGVPKDVFTLLNEGTTMQKGKPILPAIIRIVVVPPEAGLELSVDAGTARIVKADREPELCMETDPHLSGNSICQTNLQNDPAHHDASVESISDDDNGVYPSKIAEMSEPFLIRGVRLVRLTTYPVQYDAGNRQYIHHDNINAQIRFTNDAPVNP